MPLIGSPKLLGKEIVAVLLYRIGFRTPLSLKNSRGRIPRILYYHSVCDFQKDPLRVPDLAISIDNFEKQMEFIKEEFNVLPLDVIVDRFKKGKATYREMAITFDDGYLDNYTHAYPILKKYGLPATIFITTGYIGSNRLFWWDKLALTLKAARDKKINWQTLPSSLFTDELKGLLSKAATQGTSLTSLTNYLKSIGAKSREEVIGYLDKNIPNKDSLSPPPRLFLSWEEINEMRDNGVSFGSHTNTHPVLTEIPAERAREEIIVSKQILEESIGRKVSAFAYPDGCLNDEVKKIVEDAGYGYALQTGRYLNVYDNDRFAIPRKKIKEGHSIGLFGKFSAALFSMELSGVGDILLKRNERGKNPYGN